MLNYWRLLLQRKRLLIIFIPHFHGFFIFTALLFILLFSFPFLSSETKLKLLDLTSSKHTSYPDRGQWSLCTQKRWVHILETLWSYHRSNSARTDKFVPQYMRMFDQTSHSSWSICTCNHEVVVFSDTSAVVIFCYLALATRSCERSNSHSMYF